MEIEKPIETVLDESKKNIEEKTNEAIKKRGRPKNSTNNSGNASIGASSIGSASTAQALPTNVDYTLTLKSIFAFSGSYLSSGTKFKGFELSDEECTLLATQGNEVMKQFAPQINSKYTLLGTFVVSIAGIYGMKYMAYKDHVMSLPLKTDSDVQTQMDIKEG